MGNKFLLEILITRKNYDKTSSAKYKGKLQVVSNQHGIIKDWKIEFTEVFIDLYTTPRWFQEHNTIFRVREKLFKELDLAQESRPNQKENKLIKLSVEQLEKLNNFLNDREKYKSTLKNMVGVLKGNNPGGEAGKPDSAEMIIDNENSNLKNFIILFDDLISKNNDNFNVYAINAKKVNLESFSKINDSLKNAFEFMQKSKTKDSFQDYLKNIKGYYQKHADWDSMGTKTANKAREKYADNVKKNILMNELPFGFRSYVEFQRCHIFEFYVLRDKIIEAYTNGRSKEEIEKYADMISDHENFLPLPESLHRQFDRDLFTYKEDGSIWAINEEGNEFIKKFVDSRFKTIPKSFLTEKRVFYIKERNLNINF